MERHHEPSGVSCGVFARGAREIERVCPARVDGRVRSARSTNMHNAANTRDSIDARLRRPEAERSCSCVLAIGWSFTWWRLAAAWRARRGAATGGPGVVLRSGRAPSRSFGYTSLKHTKLEGVKLPME